MQISDHPSIWKKTVGWSGVTPDQQRWCSNRHAQQRPRTYITYRSSPRRRYFLLYRQKY